MLDRTLTLPEDPEELRSFDAAGLPMRTEITPGQTSDYLGFDLVMADNPSRRSCSPTAATTLTRFAKPWRHETSCR